MSAPSTLPPTVPSQYGYTPHEYVAIIFLVVFGMSTVLHIGQATRYRMWWLFPTACLCGIGEVIGWAGRLWSSFSPTLHKPFMIQIVSLVVSPTPLIAVNFVLLSWIVTQLGPCYSLLSPQWYTAIFLFSDIIALLVQAAGGSIAGSATTASKTQLGAHTMLGGILFQFAAMIIFCCTACDFFVRYFYDRPVKIRTSIDRAVLQTGTNHMICTVAFSTLVLFIRSIYRIIELASGWHSSFMLNELYFNVLDGMMVAFALVSLNFGHPGRLMGPRKPQSPAEKEKHEMGMMQGRGNDSLSV
ncbi:RTA1-domain-containing protein [Mycena sanguinolenta]|uniref:RTA1-domain-containing protein n=1 Tax=Mycena sanguinolenta TaxID=230812 RepID=A0A8H6XLH5_9AGAR|nr:RTA1-domain-containing protein [Mycena sanguinolenta]